MGEESKDVFRVVEPRSEASPIVISVPHSGTSFDEISASLLPSTELERPSDTDWFVDRVYEWAPSLGITLIKANYSRYLIDLNRDPEDKALYNDGRLITGLVPLQKMDGTELYQNPPSREERLRRIKNFHEPYHKEVAERLSKLRRQHGHVLLWEAHSIRRHVPTIRQEPFPDLMLGDGGGETANPQLVNIAREKLGSSSYSVHYNDPFRGGFITRKFGQPW